MYTHMYMLWLSALQKERSGLQALDRSSPGSFCAILGSEKAQHNYNGGGVLRCYIEVRVMSFKFAKHSI